MLIRLQPQPPALGTSLCNTSIQPSSTQRSAITDDIKAYHRNESNPTSIHARDPFGYRVHPTLRTAFPYSVLSLLMLGVPNDPLDDENTGGMPSLQALEETIRDDRKRELDKGGFWDGYPEDELFLPLHDEDRDGYTDGGTQHRGVHCAVYVGSYMGNVQGGVALTAHVIHSQPSYQGCSGFDETNGRLGRRGAL